MSQVLWLVCGLACILSLNVGYQIHAALGRLRWRGDLPSRSEAALDELVSVIVPARNEVEDLSFSVRSILDQTGIRLEVILINDHSTDQTGKIADELACLDPRLKVIHNPELPDGWLGKSNAMQRGVEATSGRYLLFTDADVIHQPECFATALGELERDRLDFLSLFPRMRFVSFWENVILPIVVSGVAEFASSRIEDPTKPDALGVGAFILVRAETLEAVGGLAAIRGEMLDDVSLARLVKSRGGRVAVRAAPGLLDVRLFKGNRHAFWGTTKNILEGFRGRVWATPLILLLPFLVFWTPLIALGYALAKGEWPLAYLALCTYLVEYGCLWLGRELFGFDRIRALAFPLSAVVVACCAIRAGYLYQIHGAVHWRGRTTRVRRPRF